MNQIKIQNKFAVGADIGGSHITCQLFDLEKNKPVEDSKTRLSVDSSDTKEKILEGWVTAIMKTLRKINLANLAGIGFAMPGPFDYRNGIAWFEGVKKFESLYGVNIINEMRRRLQLSGESNIRFLNDAACFAIGESWLGKAYKHEQILALTLGTGFGSTFIQNKFPVKGKKGIPEDGFLYHVPFKNSVADDYFSTRWFLKEYQQKTGMQVDGVKQLADDVNKNKIAAELFYKFGENLGTFLVPWIKNIGVTCVVLGGNISKSYSLFQENLRNNLTTHGLKIDIYLTELDETAALFGSAKLCEDAYYQQLIAANII